MLVLPVPHPGVTDSRVAAADVLADLREGMLLDASFDRRTSTLDARDRRWTQELVYGLLRRREDLDAALHPRVRGGIARLHADLTDLLRLGVYQLRFMNSVPAYAAIAQTVELAKIRHGIGASKLANAVLRRIDREARRSRGSRPRTTPRTLAAGSRAVIHIRVGSSSGGFHDSARSPRPSSSSGTTRRRA